MTDLHKAAMQQALEFVEFCWRDVAMNDYAEEQRAKVEAALREALAAPVVPVVQHRDECGIFDERNRCNCVPAAPAMPGADLPSLIRQRILALPRYSFLSPMGGGVRRYADTSGRWIEYDLAAALCEPEAIDAMLAAAPKPKEQTA